MYTLTRQPYRSCCSFRNQKTVILSEVTRVLCELRSRRTCGCPCRCLFFSASPKRIVISTEAMDALIVRCGAERSLDCAVIFLSLLLFTPQKKKDRAIEASGPGARKIVMTYGPVKPMPLLGRSCSSRPGRQAYSSSTTHSPSTVQRTGLRRPFQTLLLKRSS